MGNDQLSVKVTTQLTGLNEHTLRAWERRYGAVKPMRSENGRRVYTRIDVERLRTISLLVERGFAIGRIANLSDQGLAELLAEHMAFDQSQAVATHEQPQPAAAAHVAEALLRIQTSLLHYDLAAIHGELQASRYLLGARSFTLDLISPLISLVGRLTVAGRLSICQEQALTAIVKAHLANMMLDMSPKPRADQVNTPSFAIATMEGNFHEVGIMIAAVLCACRGALAHYLGPNIPPGALAEAALALRSKHILLGASPVPPGTLPISEAEYLLQLDQKVGPGGSIWVGGALGDEAQALPLHNKLKYIKSLYEFDQILLEMTTAARQVP